MDAVIAPTRFRKRMKAHGVPTRELVVFDTSESGSGSDFESSNEHAPSSSYRGNPEKRRRMRSGSRPGHPATQRGQRCSTLADIEDIALSYNNAWNALVDDLTPLEAIIAQRVRYEHAWRALILEDDMAAEDRKEAAEYRKKVDNDAQPGVINDFVLGNAADYHNMHRSAHDAHLGELDDALFDVTQRLQDPRREPPKSVSSQVEANQIKGEDSDAATVPAESDGDEYNEEW